MNDETLKRLVASPHRISLSSVIQNRSKKKKYFFLHCSMLYTDKGQFLAYHG